MNPNHLTSPDTAKLIFDTMPRFLYFVKDPHFRFTSLNCHLAEKIGFPEAEIIGKTDYDFFPKSLADSYRKDDELILQTKQPILNKVELVPSNKGQADWSLTNKLPVIAPTGEVTSIVGITRPFSTSETALSSSTELQQAIAHIKSSFSEKISIPELAKLCNLSVSAFERKFKKLFHTTPSKFITNTRIQHACHLLSNSTEELIDIGSQSGFFDQSHFSREFTKVMNISPLQYRKKYRI